MEENNCRETVGSAERPLLRRIWLRREMVVQGSNWGSGGEIVTWGETWLRWTLGIGGDLAQEEKLWFRTGTYREKLWLRGRSGL